MYGDDITCSLCVFDTTADLSRRTPHSVLVAGFIYVFKFCNYASIDWAYDILPHKQEIKADLISRSQK